MEKEAYPHMLKSTEKWKNYWVNRDIDWLKAYGNWDHPHRFLISSALMTFGWRSLFEVGCGAGANLVNIIKNFKEKQVGGCDIAPEAVAAAGTQLKGAILKVGSVEDIMMSDSSTDVVLSDMCLIYIEPSKIDGVIEEMKRVARSHLVLCEFHHESWIKRLQLRFKSGYNSYNYKALLEKHGFYDIQIGKIPENYWPGGEPQKTYGNIIIARLPKRK